MTNLTFTVNLRISSEDFVAYYKGAAKRVSAKDQSGKVIEFPAFVLRPYLTSQGIEGQFQIKCDEQNRFIAIERIPIETSIVHLESIQGRYL